MTKITKRREKDNRKVKSKLKGGGTKVVFTICCLDLLTVLPRPKSKWLHAPNRAVPSTTSYIGIPLVR